MAHLLKNNILVVILFFLCGCVTSTYHAGKQKALGTDIEVTPDRVVTECEFITDYEGDYSAPYGFMIYLLDNDKTVLTLSSATVLEKKDCFDILKISNRIIQNARLVTVRGRGDAESPAVKEQYKYTFSKHGTFYGNGRSLNFLAIWNDRGQCYDAFHHGKEECQK